MRSIAALSALSVALAMPAPAAEPATIIPMAAREATHGEFTRADGSANMPAILASLNKTLAKYKAAPLPYYPAIAAQQQQQGLVGSLGLKKRQQAKNPLTDQNEAGVDELYYGPSTIGSGDGKPQGFTLDFDTGSSDIFIPGPTCGTAQGCHAGPKYDQGGQDQHKTTTVTYGSGQISGEDYVDDVSVAGLKANKQALISLSQATGFSGINSDGLMGMGFSTISEEGKPTYFETLMSQGTVTNKEFAFYLGRAKSGTQGNSELALGGRNPSKFTGTPTAVAVTTPGYWQVALDSVKVNGKSVGAQSAGQAAIDTGTTVVLVPTAVLLSLVPAIPGSFPIPMGAETLLGYPCNTDPKYVPSITFGGKDYKVSPLDFNLGTIASNFGVDVGNNTLAQILASPATANCVAGFIGGDINPTENLYVVGDVFLKSWYSIYNYVALAGKPAVLFAKAVGN